MTSYLNVSELVNRATGGNSGLPELIWMHKEPRVAGAAAAASVGGRYTSLWQYEGNPSHGAVPAATPATAPTNATQGAWGQVDPGGGRQKWQSAVMGVSSAQGVLYLYDRLLHVGGMDATVTTAQNVAGSLTRNTGGLGNEIWGEIYTQIGATGTTITANYTNSNGTAGQITQPVSFGGATNREAQRMFSLSLAAGDRGVRAVASATVLATTGTAGAFGINVLRRLCAISIGGSASGSVRTFVDGPFNEVVAGACLAWMFLANGAGAILMDGWAFNTER